MTIYRLDMRAIARLRTDGLRADGNNLYVRIRNEGRNKNFVFRYRQRIGNKPGKKVEMGLGSISKLSINDARQMAEQFNALLARGIDPLTQKKTDHQTAQLAALKRRTFRDLGEEFYQNQVNKKVGPTSLKITRGALRNYLYPVLGNLLIADIEPLQIKVALEPVWYTAPVMGRRVREVAYGIFHLAKQMRCYQGDNPAARDGPLGLSLPYTHRSKPHDGVHFKEVPAIMEKLQAITAGRLDGLMTTAQAASAAGVERQPILNAINKGKLPGRKQMDGKTSTWLVEPADVERVLKVKLKTPDVSSVHLAIYILQFLLLNPTRFGQVNLLPWSEIKGDMWTCPPDRHKAGHKNGREYLIPLSTDSMKILEIMRARNIDSPYVFARGHTPAGMNLYLGKPLTRECVIVHLRRISGHPTITHHSIRRNFSSWANDQDKYTRETIETMLGHTWGSAAERAYTLDARRIRSCRRLSQDWADYVMGRSRPEQISETPSADILPLQATS